MNWKTIRSSTSVLMFVIIISKLIGMGRDVFLANYFGTSAVSDAYLIAVSIPTLLFHFIGHALSTVYQPMYNRIRSSGGERAANRYSNNLMWVAMLVASVIVAVLLLFPKEIVKLFAVGFSEDTADLAALFVRICAGCLYFMVAVNILCGYLNINRLFLVSAAVSVPRNIVIILSVVLAAYAGAYILGVGLLIAYVAEFVFLLPFALRSGYRFRSCLDLKDDNIKKSMCLVMPVMLGVSVSQINKIIDRSLASTICEGGISALSYASILNNAVQEVAVTGIITVLFTTCASLVAKGEHEQVRAKLTQTLDTMSFLLVPASFGIICLAEPIVVVVLGRGNFDATSVSLTKSALQCYTVGLFFLAARDTLVKVFYAYEDTKTPMRSSVMAIIMNIVLNFVLSRFMGLSGLALATSLSAVFQLLSLFYWINKKHLKLPCGQIVSGMLFSVLLSGCMALVIWPTYHHWLPQTISMTGRLASSVFAGVVVYVVLNLIFNRKRTQSIVRSIIK